MRNIYIDRYNKLIDYARSSQVGGYLEIHHIIPKSLGGDDNPNNLIILSSRMHFLAHWMLWKAYDTDELAYAFWAMSHQKKRGQEKRYSKINSKTYALLKERRSKLISESNSKRWQDPSWAEKMSQKIKECKSDPLLKQKYSELMSKRNADPEYRKHLEGKRKEKYNDPVWKENYKQIQKKAHEHRIKPIIVDGIKYQYVTDVATKFKISIPTVRQRIKSKSAQFGGWHYK